MDVERQWLTVRQAADELGVHRNTLYAAIKDGRLKCSRIGRTIRIKRIHLDQFLATGESTNVEHLRLCQ